MRDANPAWPTISVSRMLAGDLTHTRYFTSLYIPIFKHFDFLPVDVPRRDQQVTARLNVLS